MVRYCLLFILLTGIFSFSLFNSDIQKLYSNGLELIRQNNYRQSNIQLLQALAIKKHPQILFWISYNYANLKKRDSCVFYFDQILSTQPQPMEAFYTENLPKIEYWINNSDAKSVVFIPTLSKKQRDSLATRPENWGLSAENIRDQLKRIYNNSLQSIMPEKNDTLQLQ